MKTFYKIVGNKAQVGVGTKVLDGFTEYTVGEEPQKLLDGLAYRTPVEIVKDILNQKKQDLITFCENMEDITINTNTYSAKPSSLAKIEIAINTPWGNTEKEWYETIDDEIVCFMTNKVDLGLVSMEADKLIQDERVRIFGGVS